MSSENKMDNTLKEIPGEDTSDSQVYGSGEIDRELPRADENSPEIFVPSRINSGQVRVSWTKESQRIAQVEEGKSLENPSAFGAVGNIIRNIFKWRLRRSTPQVSPETGSKFIDPTRSQPDTQQGSNSKNSGLIALQTFEQSQVEASLNPFGNPSYVKSSSESDRYDEAIFSRNSAANHVPITIEEDERSEDSISLDDDNAFEDSDSQAHLEPTSYYKTKFSIYCKQPARAIWRKTYLPDSNLIYGWLMMVTIVFLYNLWLIPLRASFITGVQTPYQGMFFAFDAVSDVIYIIDIIVKFRTRYISNGVYVKDRKRLNQHHMREWTVVLDFLSIFPTDLFFLQSINPYYRINRIMRFYRVFTLYRMVELRTRIPNTWRVLQLSHFVVVLIHYNACIYYAAAVANGYGTTLSSWAFPDPTLFPEYEELTRQYTYSFYWIFHVMCSIGSRPLPETDWQFTYTILLNIGGVAMMAFTIGYVTTLLIGYHSSKTDFEKSMETARAFMKRRHLPKELRHRVERFYQHMWTNSEFSQLDEKALLRHLPLSVKQEIAIHGNFSVIKQIPEFAACDSSILRELVMRMKRRTYLPGQFIYKNGDAGSEMYIVGEGFLQSIKSSDGNVGLLKNGDVFGEMNILNLRKNHRRTCDVISCGYTELYVLDSNDVNEALSKYPRVMNMVLQQARRHRAMVTNTSNSEYGSHATKSQTSGVDSGKGSSYRSNIWEENTNTRDVTPDSALPSSPIRQVTSGDRIRVPSAIGMVIRPDLAEMLTKVYQDNLKALEKSLTDVWTKEISTLQHRIAVTEADRDEKANEVIKLREREETDSKSDKHLIKQSSTDLQKHVKVNQKTNSKDINVSKTLTTSAKVISQEKGPRKRTILPSASTSSYETPSAFASDASLQRMASQIPKNHPIQETPLDVYQSLASLKSVT